MPKRSKPAATAPSAAPHLSPLPPAPVAVEDRDAFIANLLAEKARLEELSAMLGEQLSQQKRKIDELQARLDILCKKLFGKKSERVSPSQLALAFEQLELAPAAAAAVTAASGTPGEADSGESIEKDRKAKKKAPHGRNPIPASLPRRREERDVPDADKWCTACNVAKTRIGEETATKLNVVPAVVEAVEIVRFKYGCPCCNKGVVIASSALQAVEKGLATESTLAHVAISKYADHLPLHRQERILARHGVRISRSTLCDWIGQVASALEPVYEAICRGAQRADYLHTDDTPVVMLDEEGKSRKARIWVYVDPKEKNVAYDFTLTHEKEGPGAFLQNFKGRLHADAYSGYDHLYRDGTVIEIGCWAHARRRFFDARDTEPLRANVLLQLISDLFKVEDEARNGKMNAQQRQALRQSKSAPVLALIDEKSRAYEPEVTPKSPLGEALRYMRNQWDALARFVDHGDVEIHNNPAENALRVVAVGRKNWLFAGSEIGGRRAAILYSLIASCRAAGVEPYAYIKDLLLRVATHPASRVADLTPARWKVTIQPPVVVAAAA